MLVRDYLTPDPVCANLRDGLRQTFFRMRERGIRHMPVLGDREQLVGVVSDRDLRRPDWLDEGPNFGQPYMLDNSIPVERVMSADPIVVRADDSVADALDILLAHRFGALPVVDDDRRVLGMLSTVDLLRAFRDSMA